MKYCYCRDRMNVACALLHLFAVTYGVMVEAQNCPHGWLDRPGSATCYSFRLKQKQSWSDARLECQRYDGELLKIETDKEKVWVLSQIHHIENITLGNDGWWTGLNKREQGDVTKWVWADGVALEPNLLKWAQGEPNNYLGQEHCAEIIWQGMLYDKNCDHQLYYICERPKRMVCDSRCGSMSEASLFGEFCYQFNDFQTTWDDARIRCQRDGGDLISITSETEEFYIEDHLRSGTLHNFWIGANDLGIEGVWTWSNGDIFSYFNWKSGEPNNENEEDCSAITARFGYKWNDRPCNHRMGYICKKKGLAWDARCGFMVQGNLFEGFCYQFNFNKTTWVEARTRCQAVGGDLLSITSSNEQLYIDGRLRSGTLLEYWIGANDLETEGVWRWSNGDPYVYSNWSSGEPNNEHEEDCSVITARFGYKWNDIPCNLRMGYICKKKGLEDPSSDVKEATTTIEVLGIRLGVGQIIVGSVGALVILGVFICAYVHCRRRHIPQVRQEPYVQTTVRGNNDHVYESAEMNCYESIDS